MNRATLAAGDWRRFAGQGHRIWPLQVLPVPSLAEIVAKRLPVRAPAALNALAVIRWQLATIGRWKSWPEDVD